MEFNFTSDLCLDQVRQLKDWAFANFYPHRAEAAAHIAAATYYISSRSSSSSKMRLTGLLTRSNSMFAKIQQLKFVYKIAVFWAVSALVLSRMKFITETFELSPSANAPKPPSTLSSSPIASVHKKFGLKFLGLDNGNVRSSSAIPSTSFHSEDAEASFSSWHSNSYSQAVGVANGGRGRVRSESQREYNPQRRNEEIVMRARGVTNGGVASPWRTRRAGRSRTRREVRKMR